MLNGYLRLMRSRRFWSAVAVLGLGLAAWLVMDDRASVERSAQVAREQAFEAKLRAAEQTPRKPITSLSDAELDAELSKLAEAPEGFGTDQAVRARPAAALYAPRAVRDPATDVTLRRVAGDLRADQAGPELCLEDREYQSGIAARYPQFRKAVLAYAAKRVGNTLPDWSKCHEIARRVGFLDPR